MLLDGLDEVPDPGQREQVADWIRQQITRYPGNTFIVTSRPQGYEPSPLYSARVLQLQEFSPEQIAKFLTGWYRQRESATKPQDADASVRALVRETGKHPSLRRMSANPLLLTMIVKAHRDGAALPSSRADLYAG